MGSIRDWWFRRSDEIVCRTCEVLQIELDHARREKQLLLETLIEQRKPREVTPNEPVEEQELKPIKLGRSHIPHKVRSQMIRENDLQLLEIMKKNKMEMAEARLAQVQTEAVAEDTKKEEIELLERNIFGVK